MVYVEDVALIKDGMENNAFVFQDTIKLMEFVELVTQIVLIMVETVFVTMDFMEMLINVINAILAVENVQDQKITNV